MVATHFYGYTWPYNGVFNACPSFNGGSRPDDAAGLIHLSVWMNIGIRVNGTGSLCSQIIVNLAICLRIADVEPVAFIQNHCTEFLGFD